MTKAESGPWAKRPRVALTVGFEICSDGIIAAIDALHWKFQWSITKESLAVWFGPLSLILLRGERGLTELAGGEDGADFADQMFSEMERLRLRVTELENDLVIAKALAEAAVDWAGDRSPRDPGDARLLQALWRYSGDKTEPCPECDGECGEPCAPCTVEQGIASLDCFISGWERKHLGQHAPEAAPPTIP